MTKRIQFSLKWLLAVVTVFAFVIAGGILVSSYFASSKGAIELGGTDIARSQELKIISPNEDGQLVLFLDGNINGTADLTIQHKNDSDATTHTIGPGNICETLLVEYYPPDSQIKYQSGTVNSGKLSTNYR